MKRAVLLLAVFACSDPPAGDRLSAKKLFDDIATQTPAEGVIPFDINTPLFADYTTKHRFLALPEGGTMTWSDTAAFDLPVGSTLVKTFAYAHDRRDLSAGETLLETRLIVREDDGWHASTYVYDGPNDATLQVAGTRIASAWIHDDGTERTNDYIVPNQNQCKNCHAENADDKINLLGPKARHLNRDGQLEALVESGKLVGAPPIDQWPRAARASDPTSGTVDERARAWLDISCGHCHNPNGMARTSGLFLDRAQTDMAVLGVCKAPVATGGASGGRQYDIVPGMPDASIMTFRIESTAPAVKMPEIGRNLVDDAGVALIREWITMMTGTCAG